MTATESLKARINNPNDVYSFIFAGESTFTLRSQRTGQHYTFKIIRKLTEPGTYPSAMFFVSYLGGSDNENDFRYLGWFPPMSRHIFDHVSEFKRTKKSPGEDTPVMKAFRYFITPLMAANEIARDLEVWHEGACGRCGRKLTNPESLATGIGPECARIVAGLEGDPALVRQKAQKPTLFSTTPPEADYGLDYKGGNRR